MQEWGQRDIQLLSQLLNPNPNTNRIEEDDVLNEETIVSELHKSERLNENNSYLPVEGKSKEVPKIPGNVKNKDITESNYEDGLEDLEEQAENKEGFGNWKKTPKFDIFYKQTVTPSDIYLQMGGKNPSTSSCENMVVQVHLPGQSLKNIDLKVTSKQVELSSPTFYLDLPLPQPVDPRLGKAEFDSITETLSVNLIMTREFDFINF